MKTKKTLLGMLLLAISTASVYAEEPVKTDVPAPEKKEEKKDDSSFEISALVQARMLMGQAKSAAGVGLPAGQSSYTNTSAATANDFQAVDFNFRRLRLTTKYQAAKWVGGVLDIKAENLIKLGTITAGVPGSITSIGAIQEANIWLKPGFLGTAVKLGQFKLPFTREVFSSSANQLLPEPAYSSKVIQENDIGILVQIQPLELIGKEWAKKLDIMFSVTNGDGAGDVGIGNKVGELTGLTAGSSIAKLYNWRAQINPFGLMKDGKEIDWKDGEEIFQDNNSVLLSIGAAGAYSAGYEGQSGLSSLFTSAKGYSAHTFDATFTAFGIYVNGAYTMAQNNDPSSIALGYSTFQGTLGYNLNLGPVSLMPMVRYDYQAYDSNNDGVLADTEKQSSLWIGANLFAIKHNLKLQVFYNILNDAASSSDVTKPLGKNMLYFQLQTSIGKKV